MKKIVLFIYCFVFVSAISLDELQDLMIDKKYDIHGIFYKYDFANIEPAWDFVYVANDVFYQLKGSNITSNNVFGWKIIDKINVQNPSFYFVYLADIDEDNETKYDWVALDKKSMTSYKLNGSTSDGYFSWSDRLSKISFSFSEADKKVTFHRSINGGSTIGDTQLPKLPDLPDRLLDINSSSGLDDNTSSSNTDSTSGSSDNNNSNSDSSGSSGSSDNTDTSGSSGDTNKDENGNDCTSYVDEFNGPPSPGVCLRQDNI